MSKNYSSDKPNEFGLNELLYDVLVCKVDHIDAVKKTDAKLVFVSEGIWAVESEMAKNSRQALYDFNKLLLSSCKSKLFVGPLTNYNDELLEMLISTVEKSHCSGTVYFALIPHPGDWEKLKAFNQEALVIESLTFNDFGITTAKA